MELHGAKARSGHRVKDRDTADVQRRLRQLETATQMTSVGGGTSSWVAPTLMNAWANYGGPEMPCGYCKDAAGFVHLRGLVKRTISGVIEAVIFVLPAGYRPAFESNHAVVAFNKFARLVVTANGNVYVEAVDSGTPEGFVSLDGVTFDTRA